MNQLVDLVSALLVIAVAIGLIWYLAGLLPATRGWIPKVKGLKKVLKWTAGIALVWLVLASITSAGLTRFTLLDDLLSVKSDPPRPAITPLPRIYQELAQDRYVASPLDKEGWLESPSEVNFPLNSRQTEAQYVMNLTFMETLNYHITAGETGTSVGDLRVGLGKPWRAIRPKVVLPELPDANCLHIKGCTEWPAIGVEDPNISLHFLAEPPEGAVVIRTEKLIPAGTLAVWGPMWTMLDSKPLSVSLRIIVLGDNKLPVPPEKFTASRPYIIFAGEDEPILRKHGRECLQTVSDFTEKSVGVKDGKTLAIDIPEEFGDAFVLVNLKITNQPR